MNMFRIDPDERLDIVFDWASQRLEAAETIASFVVTSTAGITVSDTSEAAGKVTVWLTGADKSVVRWPKVTCRVVTSTGRIMDDTITLRVSDA